MNSQFSALLAGSLLASDQDVAVDVLNQLIEFVNSEAVAVLALNYLGMLTEQPIAKLRDWLSDHQELLVQNLMDKPPLRDGSADLKAQVCGLVHLDRMELIFLRDQAYIQANTSVWGVTHFQKMSQETGIVPRSDLVQAMASASSSWRGRRSDFLAVLGLYVAQGIPLPFVRIDIERVEAVVAGLNQCRSLGYRNLAAERVLLELCRKPLDVPADAALIHHFESAGLDRDILINAFPESMMAMELGL